MLESHKAALLWLRERHTEKVAVLAADGYPEDELVRLAWQALGVVPPGAQGEEAA